MRRRTRMFECSLWNLGLWGDARRHRVGRERDLRRFAFQPEVLERRALLTTITRSGGVGGITETLPLPADLNLVTFTWENYSIPDEFQVQQGGQRIAGDVGLHSGGRTGKTVVAKIGSTTSLTVKVTAPTQGTAWDFTVDASAVELHVDAKLGDVTKVDIGKIFQTSTGLTLGSVGLDPSTFQLVSMTNPKGKVAEIDNWQDELENGVFYFVPTVTGTPLDYLATHTTDAGLGDSELRLRGTVTDDGGTTRQIEFPVEFTVTDGFSTTGDNQVNGAGTTKLDIYRHQQRLAYLGYPGANGNPLAVDGGCGATRRTPSGCSAWRPPRISRHRGSCTSNTKRVQAEHQQALTHRPGSTCRRSRGSTGTASGSTVSPKRATCSPTPRPLST